MAFTSFLVGAELRDLSILNTVERNVVSLYNVTKWYTNGRIGPLGDSTVQSRLQRPVVTNGNKKLSLSIPPQSCPRYSPSAAASLSEFDVLLYQMLHLGEVVQE